MIFKRDNEFYIPCKTYCRYILNYVNVVHLVRVTKVFFNYAIIFRDTSAYVKYRHLWAARHLLGFRLREIENFVATCPLFYGASGKRTEEKRQIIRFVRIIGLRRATGAITRVLSLSAAQRSAGNLSEMPSSPSWIFLLFFWPPSRHHNENGEVWNWRAIFWSSVRSIIFENCPPVPWRYETRGHASRNSARLAA